MTEIHINDPQPFDDDIAVEKSLRPNIMDEFIGQKDIVDSLKNNPGSVTTFPADSKPTDIP